jgi:hypothetical protein
MATRGLRWWPRPSPWRAGPRVVRRTPIAPLLVQGDAAPQLRARPCPCEGRTGGFAPLVPLRASPLCDDPSWTPACPSQRRGGRSPPALVNPRSWSDGRNRLPAARRHLGRDSQLSNQARVRRPSKGSPGEDSGLTDRYVVRCRARVTADLLSWRGWKLHLGTWPTGHMSIRLVAICGFHCVSRNPHRVDTNDDRCADLD